MQVPPKAEETNEFWSKFWDNLITYKEDGEWLKEVELELENVNIQKKVEITKEDITMQLRKMANWKAPGCKLGDTRHDGCNQNEIDSLVRKIEIVTKDKGMKLVIEKCVF